ncbi:MAG: aminodeoxychorismate synthase component I [Halioglobus sp.]
MRSSANKTLYLEELPYRPDSCELFERIKDLPFAAMLDSSYPRATSGRYDILVADPVDQNLPELSYGASEAQCSEYYTALGQFHQDRYARIGPAAQDIPFCGGLLGYLGYDSGLGLHKVPPKRVEKQSMLPSVGMHAYDWCVVQDHVLRRAVFVAQPEVGARARRDLLKCLRTPGNPATEEFVLSDYFTSSSSQDEYRRAFERIQGYIQAGDCYQVNLAQCFRAPYSGDPWSAYKKLRSIASAPYSGYIDLEDDGAVMSLSPERFITLHGHHVETAPIKGTRPRYSDRKTDQLAASELQNSEKDRAENLMIVDLLRNDLGRNCVPGSIHVDKLFELQSFPTVHHLVSTISGELRDDVKVTDLLRDSFPGGSITGAPKRRAMEIIAELEPDPRQVYCGSLLYISADGRMDSNIAIRTLLCNNGEVRCWGGGGIISESQWQHEYQETYDKVGRFLSALETTLPED